MCLCQTNLCHLNIRRFLLSWLCNVQKFTKPVFNPLLDTAGLSTRSQSITGRWDTESAMALCFSMEKQRQRDGVLLLSGAQNWFCSRGVYEGKDWHFHRANEVSVWNTALHSETNLRSLHVTGRLLLTFNKSWADSDWQKRQ